MKTIDISLKARLRVNVQDHWGDDDAQLFAAQVIREALMERSRGDAEHLSLNALLSVGPVIGGGQ